MLNRSTVRLRLQSSQSWRLFSGSSSWISAGTSDEPISLERPTVVLPPPAQWTKKERRKQQKAAFDLRLPHEMYPAARSMRRRVVAHVGPTNSGKTHAALEALTSARSGVYCGPLRLLAWEVFDRLSNGERGVPCTLRTGQEIREAPGAAHTSCTIEMCSLTSSVDVAVVDEIQMLSHPERGWAWSRALLGLPARELHVCGSTDALPLLRALVSACGDELIEREYERLSPLHIGNASLGSDLGKTRAGDCVVAFSRREIFDLKQRIEASGGPRCGVVYGSLPPETRRTQASLFNDPSEPEDVLVASDAVGMGLNLNIQRIVFAAMSKFDGECVRALKPTEVLQIAGRAGRYKSRFGGGGEVTCLHRSDMPALRAALGAPLQPLHEAGLAPTFEQLELFDRASRHALSYAELLRQFEETARLGRRYFSCALGSLERSADVVERSVGNGLSLLEVHTLCQAPLDARDPLHATLLQRWARDLASDSGGPVRIRYAPPSRPPATHAELQSLEAYFRALDGYLWLAQRFPHGFCHDETARQYRSVTAELIDTALNEGLEMLGRPPPAPSASRSGTGGRAAGRARGGGRGSPPPGRAPARAGRARGGEPRARRKTGKSKGGSPQ
jgi:ATP-dependent RNA helicase SUPV3L1/SUV3